MLEFEDGVVAHRERLDWHEAYTREPGDVHGKILAAQLNQDAVLVRGNRRMNQHGCVGDWVLVFNGETYFCHKDSFASYYTSRRPDDHAEPSSAEAVED